MKKSKIAKTLSIILSMALMFSLNSLSVFAGNSHSHKICGSISHDECTHGDEAFTVFDPNSIVDSATNRIRPGNYYLNSDINLADFASFHGGIDNGTVTVCLNGHTITGKEIGSVFVNYQKGTFNLCDCGGNGKIVGKGIINLGKFNMYGGEITGIISSGNYAPVTNHAGSTFTMYGGKITGNTPTDTAGAVYNSGTFIMKNGEISNNKNYPYSYENGSTSGGYAGGVYNTNYFEMHGGKIVNNAGIVCGGVNNTTNNAVFKLYGGEISGNYLLNDSAESNIRDVNNNTQYLNQTNNNQNDQIAENLDGVYYLKNAYSGKYLDVAGVSADDGANIQQWSYTGADNQKFKLVSDGSGYYSIMTGVTGYSKAIDIDNWNSENGANVIQWEYHGGDCQKFRVVKVGDAYVIKTKVSGNARCFDVEGPSANDGTNVHQWDYYAGTNQMWYLEPASEGSQNSASASLEGTYYIKNVNSGKYLDVAGNSADNGANIHQWEFNGSVAQQFKLVSDGNGFYTIRTGSTDFNSCVDVEGISADNGANIHQWSYTGADNQLFQLVQIGDAWAIKTKVSSCYSSLDVDGWGTDNGTNIAQWEYHGGDCQLWYLERV